MINTLKEHSSNYINAIRTTLLSKTKKRYLSVLIDTTNGCNLRCKFCTRSNKNITKMSEDNFNLIMKKIHKQTKSLQLSCAWEYSIAKNAPAIIRILEKYSIPNTTIYSNGNILSPELIDAIIDAKINNYVVSIGESNKETYERLRIGGNFNKVLENITKLTKHKIIKNSASPRICANLTLMNSNLKELPDFIELADKIGINEIRGRHLILNKGLDLDNEVVMNFDKANAIIEKSLKKASTYGMSFSVPAYSSQNKGKSCRAPWQQLYISSNGNISICPRIHNYERLGNLLKESFIDIVKNEKTHKLKNQFYTKEFKNPVCGICTENMESSTYIDQGF